MPRTSPEKREAVLADFRSKKMTSAAELAKAHGLSRSSVYRILAGSQTEKNTGQTTGQKGTLSVRHTKPEETDVEDDDDNQSEPETGVTNNFFYRSAKFADDLGLPELIGRPTANNDQKTEEREEAMDAVIDQFIMGKSHGAGDDQYIPTFAPPPQSKLLDELLDSRPQPQPTVITRYEPVPDPYVVRPDVIQRIVFNVEHFGPLVKPIVGPNPQEFIQGLANRPDRELTGLLTAIERARSVGNIASGFKQTFFVVAQATEVTTKFIGLKPDGFTERLKQQEEEIGMIMKEIAIDQWQKVKAMDRPELRLGLMFCMTLVQTDANNRLKEHMARFSRGQTAQVPASVVENHADL